MKPPRVNYINIHKMQHEYLSQFTEHTFQIRSFDGILIECLYLEYNENSGQASIATAIYNHSHGSCKYEGSNLIKHCAAYAYDLCLFDSRGCGRSGDNSIYFGFREHIDLLYIILKLTIAYKRTGFVLWGRSIGCNAVLQLYHFLVANEGEFLNRQIERRQEKTDTGSFKRVASTVSIRCAALKYPEQYNKLLHEHLDIFLMHNLKNLYGSNELNVQFFIYALVLDSPYSSFVGFLKDNVGKMANFMTLVSTPLSHYLKNYVNKRLDIDLDTRQNINLVETINISGVFLISDDDEIIPYDSFKKLADRYGAKFKKRNEPRVYNTRQKHGSFRSDSLLSNCLLQIITSMTPMSMYNFQHKHQSDANVGKKAEMNSELLPQKFNRQILDNTFANLMAVKPQSLKRKRSDGLTPVKGLCLRKCKSELIIKYSQNRTSTVDQDRPRFTSLVDKHSRNKYLIKKSE